MVPPNGPYSYQSGYEMTIGCPLGLRPNEVDNWILSTGIPMRQSYPHRAPDRDVHQPRADWIALLLQLYLDRQATAAQVNDPETDWARIPWNHGQNPTTIPDEIRLPLHNVFRELKRRIDRYGRRQHPPAGIPRARTHAGPLPPAGPPPPAGPLPPAGPPLPAGPLPAPALPPAFALSPILPDLAASAPSTLGPTNQQKFTGTGVDGRQLTLELMDKPDDWPDSVGTPEENYVDIIRLSIWLKGADDSYDPISSGYKVTLLFRWETIRGRDKRTGGFVEKNTKAVIGSEADLVNAFVVFSKVPLSEPLELFFELQTRATAKVLHDIDPEPLSASGAKRPHSPTPDSPSKRARVGNADELGQEDVVIGDDTSANEPTEAPEEGMGLPDFEEDDEDEDNVQNNQVPGNAADEQNDEDMPDRQAERHSRSPSPSGTGQGSPAPITPVGTPEPPARPNSAVGTPEPPTAPTVAGTPEPPAAPTTVTGTPELPAAPTTAVGAPEPPARPNSAVGTPEPPTAPTVAGTPEPPAAPTTAVGAPEPPARPNSAVGTPEPPAAPTAVGTPEPPTAPTVAGTPEPPAAPITAAGTPEPSAPPKTPSRTAPPTVAGTPQTSNPGGTPRRPAGSPKLRRLPSPTGTLGHPRVMRTSGLIQPAELNSGGTADPTRVPLKLPPGAMRVPKVPSNSAVETARTPTKPLPTKANKATTTRGHNTPDTQPTNTPSPPGLPDDGSPDPKGVDVMVTGERRKPGGSSAGSDAMQVSDEPVRGITLDGEMLTVKGANEISDADEEQDLNRQNRMTEFMSKPVFERDYLARAMKFFQIKTPHESICPWISKDVTLKPHQVVGVFWMINKAVGTLGGGILADDCGLGKTMTSLAFVLWWMYTTHEVFEGRPYPRFHERFRENFKRVAGVTVILVPATLVTGWTNEWDRITKGVGLPRWVKWHSWWAGNTDRWGALARQLKKNSNTRKPYGNVVITSYETWTRRIKSHLMLPKATLAEEPFPPTDPATDQSLLTRVICDEAHLLRNADRQDHGYIVRAAFAQTFLLTATPLVRSFDDLHQLMIMFSYKLQQLEPLAQAAEDKHERFRWRSYVTQLENLDKVDGPLPDPDSKIVDLDLAQSDIDELNMPEDVVAEKKKRNYERMREQNRRIDKQNFLTSRNGILRKEPKEDSYVVTSAFWEKQDLSRKRTGRSWSEHGRLVSYILMQLLLRRTLTSRLTMPNGCFERFLDIPPMEIKTLALKFKDAADQAPFLAISKSIMAREDLDDPLNKQRVKRMQWLYKAGLCPGMIDVIKWQQGQGPRVLWVADDTGYPIVDVIRKQAVSSLLGSKIALQLLFSSCVRGGKLHMPHRVSDWPRKAKRGTMKAMWVGSPKLRWLSERLEGLKENPEEKLIIWCNFPVSQWIVTLFCLLHDIEARAYASTANSSPKQRADMVDQFNTPMSQTSRKPIKVLVMSFLVSGLGLNLWAQCHENIVMENSNSYASEYQAWCRVRRIGQTKQQLTTRLVNRETLDAQIETAMALLAQPMAYAMQSLDKFVAEHGEEAKEKTLLDVLVGSKSPAAREDVGLQPSLMIGATQTDFAHDPEVNNGWQPPKDSAEEFVPVYNKDYKEDVYHDWRDCDNLLDNMVALYLWPQQRGYRYWHPDNGEYQDPEGYYE
ncbi:MAG: hypothetical protein M1816_004376 [Peltula sp. TS41687]|nr:MAG: hypothetical protein M1816_004376 [Peltula sp. TS41687]